VRAIARLQDDGQLDQRVGDVGMVAPFAGLVTAERAAAGSLGQREAPGGAERDRALVGRDGGC
jgi:hypothetical protein